MALIGTKRDLGHKQGDTVCHSVLQGGMSDLYLLIRVSAVEVGWN